MTQGYHITQTTQMSFPTARAITLPGMGYITTGRIFWSGHGKRQYGWDHNTIPQGTAFSVLLALLVY
jgi:hypothetical protein